MSYGIFKLLLLTTAVTGGNVSSENETKAYAIIAHPNVTEDSIDPITLKSIYLGRKKQWTSGQRIVVVHSQKKSVFEPFSKVVLRKSVSQFRMFWRRMVFTGKGSMPKKFNKDSDVINYVKSVPGAIAVINAKADMTGVKTLMVRE